MVTFGDLEVGGIMGGGEIGRNGGSVLGDSTLERGSFGPGGLVAAAGSRGGGSALTGGVG